MLASPLPEERRVSSLVQQRRFAFLLRLFILVVAQQSVPLLRGVVEPTAMLKASSALVGFLLAPQVALAQTMEPDIIGIQAGNGQIRITWTDPSDSTIDSYKVRYRKRVSFTSSDLPWTEKAIPDSSATTTTYTLTELDNGYDYDFEIAAVRSGEETWSAQYSTSPFGTSATAPVKPTGFTATAGDGSVTLSWTASTDLSIGAYQYQYQKGTGPISGWISMTGSTSRSKSYTVEDLDNNAAYKFKIRSWNSVNYSPATDWVTVTPAVPTSAGFTVSPTDLWIGEGSNGTYTVKLNAAPTSDVTVTVGGTSGDVTVNQSSLTFTSEDYSTPQEVIVSAGADTDTTDDTATLTHSYAGGGGSYTSSTIPIAPVMVTVIDTGTSAAASNNDGGNEGSPTPVVTPATAPAAPTALGATGGNGQVTLSWTDPDDDSITVYQFRQKKGNGAWGEWTDIPNSDADTTSHTVTNLDNDAQYSFEVRAKNTAGDGTVSTTVSATPTATVSGGGGSTSSTPTTPSAPSSPSSPSAPARTTGPTAPAFQLLSDPAAVTEGEAITLELTSSSPLTGTHAVSLTFSDRNSSGFTAADIPGSLGPRSFNAEFGSSPSKTGKITIPTSRDDDVEGRESYRIKLNAGSGYRLGNDVTADGMLLDPLPAKPTGLTATPGHGEVTLNWDDPSDASITVWQVQYKEADGSYSNWMNIPNSTASTTRHTVTGLKDGIRYEFRLRAVNEVGAGEASDPVTAKPLHPDAARASKARKASLVGLSRATLSSATDVIGGRISGELTTPTSSDGSIGEQALGIVEDLLGISDTTLPSSLSMEGIGEQLWHQTFQLSPPASAPAEGQQRAQAADTTAAPQRNWALWGAGNLQRFSGEDGQERMSYEGNLKTAWVGIDQQFRAPWHGGVAASFAMGESDYSYERTSGEGAGGRMKSRVTTFYPYGSVQLNERLRLWGTAGLGFGELRHQESSNDDADTQQQEEQEGDLRMQLAVAGFEQQLSSLGRWDFSLAGDVGLIKTSSQWPDHSGLEDLSMTLTRARLGVDSSFPLGESTRGYLNLRGRMDGGEQQMGAAEAVAGLQYSAARLSALLQGRQTYAFNGDYSESGIMGQLLFSSQEDGTGLALELQPSYGHYGDAQQPFFFDDDQLQALTGQGSSQKDGGLGLKSMLGYGFRPHDADLLLTPFAELSFSQGRRYLLGVGLSMEAPPWEVKLTGSREETGNLSPTGKLQLLFSTQL